MHPASKAGCASPSTSEYCLQQPSWLAAARPFVGTAVFSHLFAVLASCRYSYDSVRKPDDDGLTCFELLGFDVLVDDALRPWLLEVGWVSGWAALLFQPAGAKRAGQLTSWQETPCAAGCRRRGADWRSVLLLCCWHSSHAAPITSSPAQPVTRAAYTLCWPSCLCLKLLLLPPPQVNHAPSLTTDTPLDLAVKSRLIQ